MGLTDIRICILASNSEAPEGEEPKISSTSFMSPLKYN